MQPSMKVAGIRDLHRAARSRSMAPAPTRRSGYPAGPEPGGFTVVVIAGACISRRKRRQTRVHPGPGKAFSGPFIALRISESGHGHHDDGICVQGAKDHGKIASCAWVEPAAWVNCGGAVGWPNWTHGMSGDGTTGLVAVAVRHTRVSPGNA